jgi:predicted RNase H-like nuclease (RuvC/YqgF family)
MRLFVGIDPGSKVGIAFADSDFKTRHVETYSRRNFSFSDIVDFLSKKGEPMVVATDKARPPLLVRKVAAAFGARLFYPAEDLKKSEKALLTRNFKVNNDHESDALSAALVSKQFYSDILEKTEKYVEPMLQGTVKKLLVTGQAASIENALEIAEFRRQQKIGREKMREKDKFSSRLAKELEDARQRNSALELEIRSLRSALEKKKYQKNDSDAMSKLRQSSLRILQEKNHIIRELEKIIGGSCVLVCSYPDHDMNSKAVILDFNDDSAVREIEKSGAVAIISDLNLSSSLPVIQKRKADIRPVGKFLVMEKPETSSYLEWLADYREKRKQNV